MAVSQNTLIGRTRQAVGGVIFSKWKGLNTLRSKPIQVKNPRSEGQRSQRVKWQILNALFRPILFILNAGFGSLAVNKSAYNVAFSKNVDAIDSSNPDSPSYDPRALRISEGSLFFPPNAPDIVVGLGGVVTLTFDDVPRFTPDGRPTTLNVALIPTEPDPGRVYGLQVPVVSDETIAAFAGVSVGSYAAHWFISAQNGQQSSDGQFAANEVTIA